MRHFPESEKLVRCGCLVLHNLSLDDKNVPHLLAFGVARPLQRAARSHKDADVQRSAVSTLRRLRVAVAPEHDVLQPTLCVSVSFSLPLPRHGRAYFGSPTRERPPPDAIDATRYETQAHGRQSMKKLFPLYPSSRSLAQSHRCARRHRPAGEYSKSPRQYSPSNGTDRKSMRPHGQISYFTSSGASASGSSDPRRGPFR